VERKQLWEIFSGWQHAAIMNQGAKLGKIAFFNRVESKGFGVMATGGKRYFVGLGVIVAGRIEA
jgi:hypothetical protein